jgi:signal transduction histidine kinase
MPLGQYQSVCLLRRAFGGGQSISRSIDTRTPLPVTEERLAERALHPTLKMTTEVEGKLAVKIRKLSDDFARPTTHTAVEIEHARLVAKLTEAVHARDTFIAIAAHELRNPMTPILGYVEHILSVGRRPESQCPEAIIIALERLAGLIGEYIKRATTLLDISRITAGKLRAELSVVDLSETTRQAVHRHRAEAERSGCLLESSIEDDVSGLLDGLAVDQIADNLLSNAVKYGAGEPIKVSLTCNGIEARLTVEDHGIGISEDDQSRIFDGFERAVTRREHGGFGVGLWLVRQLADTMHGEVHVTSRAAEGSTFTVTLPLAPT